MPSPRCLLLLLLVVAGCAGYQIGNRTLYPSHIRTVYVPIFESDSFRRNLGEQLTEALIKEIELKTPYKVVGSSKADSVISGKINRETKRLVVEDHYDDPREIEVQLRVNIRWIDRRGEMIRRFDAVPLPPETATAQGSAAAVPEMGHSVATAHQRAIQRVAEQIVAMMETPW